MKRFSRLSASPRLVLSLAIVLLREAYYQMGKYKYEERGRRPGRRQLFFSALSTSLLLNVFGLLIVLLIVYTSKNLYTGLLGAESITLVLSFLAVFENSWLLETYDLAPPLLLLSAPEETIGLSFLLASSLGVLWGLLAVPVPTILAAYRAGVAVGMLAAFSLLASLTMGSSLGFALSSLIGGRRYSGPSAKSTAMQLVNVLTYTLVFFLTYQFYTLSRAMTGLSERLASLSTNLPKLVLLLYPLPVLAAREGLVIQAVLASVLWFAVGIPALMIASRSFVRSASSPSYMHVGSPKRLGPARLKLSRHLSLQLARKDLLIIFRDIRRAPLLVIPFVVYASMLSGFAAGGGAEEPAAAIFAVLPMIAFVSNVFALFAGLNAFRVDERRGWILFACGLSRREYAKSKLLFIALIALSYYAFGIAVSAFVFRNMGWQWQSVLISVSVSYVALLLASLYPVSSMALRVSPEAYGTLPTARIELLAVGLGALSAFSSLAPLAALSGEVLAGFSAGAAVLSLLALLGAAGFRRLGKESA